MKCQVNLKNLFSNESLLSVFNITAKAMQMAIMSLWYTSWGDFQGDTARKLLIVFHLKYLFDCFFFTSMSDDNTKYRWVRSPLVFFFYC